MNFLGNILWLVFGGIVSAIAWAIVGLLWMITIIGIPFGIQCFKIAGLTLAPFGRRLEFGNGSVLGNIIWIIFGGIELAMYHVIMGLIFYVTIIGIPFGNQHFKLAKLSLIPFGAKIY